MATIHDHEPLTPSNQAEPMHQNAPSEAYVQNGVDIPTENTEASNELRIHPETLETTTSSELEPAADRTKDLSKTSLLNTKAKKIGAAVAGVGIITGAFVGGIEAASGSSNNKVVSEQSTDPSNSVSASPSASSTGSQKPTISPTSIPTVAKTTPTSNETAHNPNAGNVDLTTKTASESVIKFENDSVTVLTATTSSSPEDIANAWLSQYAYILYRGSASQGPSKGYDANVRLIEGAMTDDQDVLASLQSAIDNWRAGVGVSDVMPIFWDSPSNPAVFTKTTDTAGHIVITLNENNGPLYLNAYDRGAPWNNPNNDKWQDSHGRDVAKATKITNFSLVIDGTNQHGLPNIVSWKLLS